ncbi:hypothetical protein SO802_009721 [Lithocarpus litseifolius]|uniref:Helitron helicase-like domain-containing protein n=1 Tax=Lithocarpus litseifolius TaxID=425828 RepID=A0AAW2DD93_9ROSI
MAKMHSTNIVSSKKFGGGSHRSKKHKDIAMIHDTDSCKRARLKRRMVLNLNRTRESSSNAQCLQRSTPSIKNVFPYSAVGLNGDVATTTTVQEFGIHLPTNASALDKHLPTTELTGKFTELWNFGPPSCVCEYCNAILWYEERNRKSKNIKNPKFSICCREGRVKLPLLKSPPLELQELLQHSKHYKATIRRFNSMFAMTSMGGNVDVHANEGRGPYIFRLNGQNHHRIGSLLPVVGKDPSFAQLYIHDTKKEIHYRLSALPGQESQYDLDIAIVQILLKTLDENNI